MVPGRSSRSETRTMESETHSLENLIERAGTGDPDAVGELYELYKKRMVSIAHARLGHTLAGLTESVDLVQSVWTDLLDDIDDFEYRGPDSFYHWLRTCLVRKIDSKRRYFGANKRDSKRSRQVEDAGVITDSKSDPTPSCIVMGKEEADRLLRLLGRFPEPQREALILRIRDELSFAEIGKRIGRSTEAAKKLYQRGVDKLLEMLPADW